MKFEFDPSKSVSNKKKHGIDFDEAQKLWEDEKAILAPAISEGESRYYLISRYKEKCWTAVITFRELNIRLISVRRSRKNEEEKYYNRGVR